MRQKYRWSDKLDKLIPIEEWTDDMDSHYKSAGYSIIPDIQPYRSMIDGTVIHSRSQHRQHLKEHGCVEIGNDSSLSKQPKPSYDSRGLKEEIIRAVDKHTRRR